MDKQGKAWGETTLIFSDQRVEVHYLNINKGGYCSEHKHEWKTNLFYVIEGELLIRFWREDNIDETTLKAGQSMIIPVKIWHQFVGLTDCKCLEIYETGLWTPDIDRRSIGGAKYDRFLDSKKTMGKSKIQEKTNPGNEKGLDS